MERGVEARPSVFASWFQDETTNQPSAASSRQCRDGERFDNAVGMLLNAQKVAFVEAREKLKRSAKRIAEVRR